MSRSALLPWLMLLSAGLCLRTGIASIAPVLSAIQSSFAVQGAWLGLLTAIPVICMGVLSPLGHRLGQRIGWRPAVVAALVLLAVGIGLRLTLDTFALLICTAALVGIGDAIIRPLLSGFIKVQFAQQAPLAMGVYAASMGSGAALSAWGTGLIAGAQGEHWQAGLAVWALPAALAALIWSWPRPSTVLAKQDDEANPTSVKGAVVLCLTLYFGLQAGINYTLVAWLPSLFHAHGFSAAQAGSAIAVFLLIQTVTSLLFPFLLRLLKLQTAGGMLLFALVTLLGCILLLLPGQSIWLAAVLLGIGTGGLFPVALLLPLVFTASREAASRLSGTTQSGGYLLGGAMPWLAGVLADQLGTVAGVIGLSLVMAVILLGVAGVIYRHFFN
ncbi:MFS transporter [Enterobacterales bacterium CwR94]|nr:MFS transporter [Enterobacterales bacterium CwR94]